MSTRKPKVVVTRKLPDIIETRMMELFDCQLNLDDHMMDKDELRHHIKDCEVLIPTVTDNIDGNLIDSAGDNLRLIASFGAGIDHIDVEKALAKNIMITNTPDVVADDTADMTMGLIIAVARKFSEGEKLINSQKWQGWSPTTMLGHRIHGKRLGIIGMGRIGSALAKRAIGFGISIHYHNRKRVSEQQEQDLSATYWASLDQMLAHMDIISINCPHTPATYHLLNERRLALLQPHAFIINTSRGEVINEEALLKALQRKQVFGAGLDVFERKIDDNSSPQINPKLIKMPNVVCLPHMGSATYEGRIAMGERVILNIKSYIDHHSLPDRVLNSMF